MRKQRAKPTRQQFPGFSRRVIYDTWRGRLRVRSWPQPSKKPPSQAQRDQRDWFKSANLIARDAAPSQQRIAIEATRNTGLYPRDVILKAMSTGLLDLRLPSGRVITQRRPFIEPIMFQGTILSLGSDVSIPLSTLTTINWPVPVIDTAAMWNVATPSRLTIPNGVTVVQLYAGAQSLNSQNAVWSVNIRDQTNARRAEANNSLNGFAAVYASTGPIPVTAGDYFEYKIFSNAARPLSAAGATFFCCQILQGA